MKAYPFTEGMLKEGAKLHSFLSGGGLRVVRVEKNGELRAYGEAPSIEEALDHTEKDHPERLLSYREQYSGENPLHSHYLTGSSKPEPGLDAWVRGGNKFYAEWANSEVVVRLSSFDFESMYDRVKQCSGPSLALALTRALATEEICINELSVQLG